MSKHMQFGNLDLFPDLPPAPTPEDLGPISDIGEEKTPEVDPRLLRRFRIRPEALDCFLLQIEPMAKEFGQTSEERTTCAIFFRPEDILVAADLDRAGTRTVDGRARPMCFRARIPIESESEVEGNAIEAGAWIRLGDLIEALRNRVENSQNFGILDAPATIEVWADDEGRYPATIVVRPEGVVRPREIRTLGGAAPSQFEDLEPQAATRGIPGLDPEALIEMGAFAEDAIGVCLSIGGGNDPAYLYAVGRRGIMAGKTKSPITTQPGTFDFGENDGAERALVADAVLSPRFATAAGFAQQLLQGLLYRKHTDVINSYAARTVEAAIAASLDVGEQATGGNPILEALQEELGRKVVERAATAVKARGAEEAATEAARQLLDMLSPDDHALVSERARELADGKVVEADRGTIHRLAGGDPVLESIALAFRALNETESAGRRALAAIVGEARLRNAARRALAEIADSGTVEHLRYSDLAVAAVRLRGTYSDELTDLVLPLVPEDRAEAWWSTFEEYLSQLNVPEEIRSHLLEKRHPRRVARTEDLAFSGKTKTAWAQAAQQPAQGMFWTNADGRVYYGAGDDDLGWIMISDLAVQPDSTQYPVKRSEVEAMIERRSAVTWKTSLWSADMDWAVGRAAGIVNPDAASAEEVDERSPVRALFLARWVPAGSVESPDGGVTRHFERKAHLETPETVYIGEGANAKEYRITRNPNTPKANEGVAGTLRVFPLSIWGEEGYLDLPMIAKPSALRNTPFAFVLDAEQLNILAGYVTRKGRQIVLEASDTLVRLADNQFTRVVALPTVSKTRIPEQFQAHVAAAGVPEAGKELSIRDLVARAGEIRRTREAQITSQDSPALEPLAVVEAGSIRWHKRTRSAPSAGPGMVLGGGLLDVTAVMNSLNLKLKMLDREIQENVQALQDLVQHNIFGGLDAGISVQRRTVEKRIRELRKQREAVVDLKRNAVNIAPDAPTRGRFREGFSRLDPLLRAAEAEAQVDFHSESPSPSRLFERSEGVLLERDSGGPLSRR